MRDLPCKVITYRLFEILQRWPSIYWPGLIPVLTTIRIDCSLKIFILRKDIKATFPEVNQIHNLLITLFCTIGINKIVSCLFAIRASVAVIGKVDKLNSLFRVMRNFYLKNVNVRLNA